MSLLRRIRCGVTVAVMALSVRIGAQERGPLLASPVTLADADALAAEADGDPDEIRASISAGYLRAAYRDSDIRRLFPEIPPNARVASRCQVGVSAQSALTLRYVNSSDRAHVADITTLKCKSGESGLFCSVSSSPAYYESDPKQFFSLNGVTLDDGLELMTLLKSHSMQKQWHDLPVTKISKIDSKYEISFSQADCACQGRITVVKKSFLWFSWLVDVTDFRMNCV